MINGVVKHLLLELEGNALKHWTNGYNFERQFFENTIDNFENTIHNVVNTIDEVLHYCVIND